MSLKKYIWGMACLACWSDASAQQLPVMSHYIYNPYLYNPARTGQNDMGSINAHFKKQWVNMPYSPITGALSVETPLPKAKLGNMGIGGMVYTEQMHIITKVGAMATYAYHIPFEKNKDYKHALGVGVSVGMINQHFNFPDATIINPDDQQVLASMANGTSFDFSAGIDYHFRDLHVGGAMLQGLNNGIKFLNPQDQDIKFINSRHWIVTASYHAAFGSKEKKHRPYVEPVFLGRIIQGLPFQAEGTVLVGMEGIAWLGIGYRSNNTETTTSAIMATAGVDIGKHVRAAYTIDLGIDKNLNASLGTQHEFMLSYRFGRGSKDDGLKDEIEKLKKKDQEIQDKAKHQVDSIHQVMGEQEQRHQEQVDGMQGTIDKQAQDLKDLEGQVLRNKEDIEELKRRLAEKKITHKHIGEVFFDVNSDKLSPEIKSHLNTMKQMLDGYPKNITVYLYGNASVEGSPKENMELAVRRGAAVRQYLLEIGVNATKVYVIPMGEYNPVGADPNKQEKKDRRLDIMVNQDE